MGFYDDEDEILAEEASSGYRKRKASRTVDEEEFEEEEEEEDEEDDDREARRRSGVSMFVDDYAGVDEGEESEDEDEEYEGDDLIADAQEDLPVEDHHAQRLYRPMHEEDADEDPDVLEEYINQRYESQYNQSEAPVVTQQSLLPTLLDPKLWVVQCRPGTERMLCIQLLGKFHAPNRGTSLMIKSAVCLDHLKGYFYVEAEKEAYVREAVKGLNNVFMSKGVKLVPLGEMVDAITVNKNAKLALEKGNWVRIRTGPYGGDLAKVADVDLANQKVTVKLIPRIDFSDIAHHEEGRGRRGNPFGHGQKVRPAAKPFNKIVAESLGLSLGKRRLDGVSNYFLGKLRFVHGYLVKTLALRSIVAQESVPPLEELQKFNAAGQVNGEEADEDLESMLDALPEGKHGLKKGDEVVVTKGELKRLTGKITEIKEDNRVRVQLNHADLTDSLIFDAGELTKHFQVGDHVRVDGGVHEGEVGMVIKVEGAMCLVMSDTTKKELRVFARDLCKAEQLDVGLDRIGDYELHDLVELDNNNYGVIVFVSKDFCKVLMADGTPDKPEVRIAGLVDIRSKVNARRNSTTDRFSNRVKTDDMIDIVHGAMKGTSGTIVYIIKGYLFIKCQDMFVNLGFVAVSARSCCVRGGKNLPGRASDMQTLRTPVVGSATPGSYKSPGPSHLQSPKIDGYDRTPGWQAISSPRHPTMSNGNGFGGGGSGSRGGSEWRSGGSIRGGRGGRGGRGPSLLHKTVKIIKGPNRGYKGRVTDEKPMHVRVELEANCKVVTVPKDNVDAGDDSEFQERRRTRTRNEPPSTPWHTTPKTPMHTPSQSWSSAQQLPTMTPLHPAMTPIHNTSGFQTFSGSSTAVKDGTDDKNNPWLQSGPTTPAQTPFRSPPTEVTVATRAGENVSGTGFTWTKTETKPSIELEDSVGPGATVSATSSIQPVDPPKDAEAAITQEFNRKDVESTWKGIIVDLPSNRKGFVESVDPEGVCAVTILIADEAAAGGYREILDTEKVEAKNLVPTKAQKHDRIRVLSGDDKGSTGSIVGIDGTDGIVKLDDSLGIKILEITCLGCVFPNSSVVKSENLPP